MKKLLSIILCVVIAMSFVACGKKTETKNSPDVKQSEKSSVDGEVNGETNMKEDEKENASAETQVLPQQTASDIENKIDEFNTTEDPERKAELRKELEEFLKQAEAMANQG